MTVADHIQKVLKPNFGAAWEEVGDEFEKEETFALASVRTLDGAYKSSLRVNTDCSPTKFLYFLYFCTSNCYQRFNAVCQ